MARAYRMTSARRAAIKKAQRISAQKRRGKKKKRIIGASIGASIAAAGVVGVTIYASRGYKNYKKAKFAALRGGVNVVAVTTAAESAIPSSSPSVDFTQGVDYGEAGVPVDMSSLRAIKSKQKPIRTRRGKVVSGSSGTKRVLRNRPKFNADRRANYNSDARSQAYQKNLERNRAKQREYAAKKRNEKRIKKLFNQSVVGNIKIDSSGAASSGWPVYPASSSARRPRLSALRNR